MPLDVELRRLGVVPLPVSGEVAVGAERDARLGIVVVVEPVRQLAAIGAQTDLLGPLRALAIAAHRSGLLDMASPPCLDGPMDRTIAMPLLRADAGTRLASSATPTRGTMS